MRITENYHSSFSPVPATSTCKNGGSNLYIKHKHKKQVVIAYPLNSILKKIKTLFEKKNLQSFLLSRHSNFDHCFRMFSRQLILFHFTYLNR